MFGVRQMFVASVVVVAAVSVAEAGDIAPPNIPQPSAAPTSPDQNFSPVAIGLTAGTLGVGGEISFAAYSFIVLRATGTWLKFSPSSLLSNLSSADNDYNFTLSQLAAGGLVDLHPFRNGFRIVGGLEYADFNFRQNFAAQSSYTINGQSYSSAEIGSLYTSVTIKNKAAPYVGVGWDSAFYCGYIDNGLRTRCDQFTIGFDLGALYTGGVSVNETTNRSVPGLAENLAAESAKVETEFNRFYSFYPVLMVTGKYRF